MSTTLSNITGNLQAELLEYFLWFHKHPELSYAEFNTTKKIKEILTSLGIEIINTNLKTGLVAIVRAENNSAAAKKTVALRADIDALPVQEESGVSYASQTPGCMHACGHDFHITALLGAAKILHDKRGTLGGDVKLVFQPAEEASGGAVQVMETGALDDVSEIYGMHVGPESENGIIAISPGATFASTTLLKITIAGKGGHAAMPHLCIDPIVAAAQLIQAAQTIVSRSTNPADRVVVSFTHIEAGKTWNTIPPSAFIEGTIRTLGTEKAKQTAARLNDICKGIGIASGCTINLEERRDAPSTDNDPALCEQAAATARALGFRTEPFVPTMAGEDFAVYQEKIRGVFIGFGVESPHALHHPAFAAQTSELARAAELLAAIAEDALLSKTQRI
ncbi:hydrolase [Spirochaetia bacterium]|nr:hydrolase [Spirochaetia bacterium]